jgi:hypothetical protein
MTIEDFLRLYIVFTFAEVHNLPLDSSVVLCVFLLYTFSTIV